MAEESIILISKDYADSNLIERGEYTDLENKVNGNTTSITDLGNTVATVQENVGTLNSSVATLEQSVEGNTQAITTLEQSVAGKQDDVGLSIGDDGSITIDNRGISQIGGTYENYFEGSTTFGSGVEINGKITQAGVPYENYFEGSTTFGGSVEIQGKKPVLDVTSQDGSVTVTRSADGYGVDLKANGGGGGAIPLGDVKAKAFNFYLSRNGNDWMFSDGETIVNIFKSLDGFIREEIGVFSFDQTNWRHSSETDNTNSFYSLPVTIYFNKETSINEILDNFTDPSYLIYSFIYAYPLVNINGNY